MSFILRNSVTFENHDLKMFEKMVIRRVFGSKNKEVIGRWRNLHNKELHNLSSSPDILILIFKEDEAGKTAYLGEKRNECKILTEKPEESNPFWRQSH